MALAPWRPFEDFSTLRREMDRVLERFFGEPSGGERPVGMWTPRTNVTETKDSLTVTAELPGLELKDVDVAISGDMLTIKGEKKQEKEEKDEYHHTVERSYGAFSRMVRLPAPVAADKIKATFKNGVADGRPAEDGGGQAEGDLCLDGIRHACPGYQPTLGRAWHGLIAGDPPTGIPHTDS